MESVILFESLEAAANNDPINIDKSNFMEPISYYDWIKNKISSFIQLKNNWDGYGGIPLIEEVAENTKGLLVLLNDSLIDGITDIFPNPNGTITMEWENSENEKLSLEIGVSNYSYFIKYNNKKPVFVNGEDIKADFKQIAAALSELFSCETPRLVF